MGRRTSPAKIVKKRFLCILVRDFAMSHFAGDVRRWTECWKKPFDDFFGTKCAKIWARFVPIWSQKCPKIGKVNVHKLGRGWCQITNKFGRTKAHQHKGTISGRLSLPQRSLRIVSNFESFWSANAPKKIDNCDGWGPKWGVARLLQKLSRKDSFVFW